MLLQRLGTVLVVFVVLYIARLIVLKNEGFYATISGDQPPPVGLPKPLTGPLSGNKPGNAPGKPIIIKPIDNKPPPPLPPKQPTPPAKCPPQLTPFQAIMQLFGGVGTSTDPNTLQGTSLGNTNSPSSKPAATDDPTIAEASLYKPSEEMCRNLYTSSTAAQ